MVARGTDAERGPMMMHTERGGTESLVMKKVMTGGLIMSVNVFDFVKEINYGKRDLMRDQEGNHSEYMEGQYNPWITNHCLSYFPDTVFWANEMNKNHHIDNALQNSFLLNTIRKRKRFSKWMKPSELDGVDAVKRYYGYSTKRAQEAMTLLNNSQINELKRRVNQGGYDKNSIDESASRHRKQIT